jgi:NB-ARC domain
VLARSGSDIPLHLEAKQYCDPSGSKPYSAQFKLLLEDIRLRRNAVPLREEFRVTYVTAPPLPSNYVERPETLANLRNALITNGSGPSIALTALKGMGGIGKTILAQALCHEDVMQQAFPDGIVWITAGKESAYNLVTRMREVGKALKDDLAAYDTELGGLGFASFGAGCMHPRCPAKAYGGRMKPKGEGYSPQGLRCATRAKLPT